MTVMKFMSRPMCNTGQPPTAPPGGGFQPDALGPWLHFSLAENRWKHV